MRRALDAARAWYGAGVPLARLRLMRVALGSFSVKTPAATQSFSL
jgi:hypothetical protein